MTDSGFNPFAKHILDEPEDKAKDPNDSPTPANVPVPEEKEIKEVIPATLDLQLATEVDFVAMFARLEELADGRLESDIPMYDDYWKYRALIHSKQKQGE